MNSNPNRDNLHKIVVLNPKGGSGKTTLATNLASYFARRGPPPTLVDCDPHGYSMRWLSNRSPERPKVYGVEAFEHCTQAGKSAQLHAWPGSNHLIVDLPAGLPEEQLYYQTYDANSILIPIMPSEIDIYSAARFIADLMLVAQYDRRNRNLAIVANRTRQNTKSFRMLMRFLTSLEIPIIAQLRDSQNFVFAAAYGIGICDMPAYKAKQDIEQMDRIIAWLDNWRMRKLDAAASPGFEHAPSAEVLTPALVRHHR
jgi:chromosome partitioning protein